MTFSAGTGRGEAGGCGRDLRREGAGRGQGEGGRDAEQTEEEEEEEEEDQGDLQQEGRLQQEEEVGGRATEGEGEEEGGGGGGGGGRKGSQVCDFFCHCMQHPSEDDVTPYPNQYPILVPNRPRPLVVITDGGGGGVSKLGSCSKGCSSVFTTSNHTFSGVGTTPLTSDIGWDGGTTTPVNVSSGRSKEGRNRMLQISSDGPTLIMPAKGMLIARQ